MSTYIPFQDSDRVGDSFVLIIGNDILSSQISITVSRVKYPVIAWGLHDMICRKSGVFFYCILEADTKYYLVKTIVPVGVFNVIMLLFPVPLTVPEYLIPVFGPLVNVNCISEFL
jgi:hypothetical protein